jgi:hypothetical protein
VVGTRIHRSDLERDAGGQELVAAARAQIAELQAKKPSD